MTEELLVKTLLDSRPRLAAGAIAVGRDAHRRLARARSEAHRCRWHRPLVSLTGLKPSATYHARFTTGVRETRTVFARERDTLQATGVAAKADAISFTTPASATPPRTFHVAPEGDDPRAGLARDSA